MNVSQFFPLSQVPAPLQLELALGHVVRDRVPGDMRERLLVRAEVAGRTSDDDREFHLPVGLRRLPRGTSTVSYGPTTVSAALKKITGSAGGSAPVSRAWSW